MFSMSPCWVPGTTVSLSNSSQTLSLVIQSLNLTSPQYLTPNPQFRILKNIISFIDIGRFVDVHLCRSCFIAQKLPRVIEQLCMPMRSCMWMREGNLLPGTSVSQTIVTDESPSYFFFIFVMEHSCIMELMEFWGDLWPICGPAVHYLIFFLKMALLK